MIRRDFDTRDISLRNILREVCLYLFLTITRASGVTTGINSQLEGQLDKCLYTYTHIHIFIHIYIYNYIQYWEERGLIQALQSMAAIGRQDVPIIDITRDCVEFLSAYVPRL